jgi:hypothetical protein
MDPRRWLDEPPQLERLAGIGGAHITVLRDDLVEGGSKLRFLPFLCEGADEVVYGGPFCGGAAHAISVWAREAGKRATLFYAARGDLHPRQIAARDNGARLVTVRPGYMSVVQARSRAYAAEAGALFLPLGFDVPAALAPLESFAYAVRRALGGDPDEVWCAAGSGMLTRVLAGVFSHSAINAVAVGLASRHGAQRFPTNVRLIPAGMPFERPARGACPFPCDPNYDLKAWLACVRQAKGRALFWNVAGPAPPAKKNPGAMAGVLAGEAA